MYTYTMLDTLFISIGRVKFLLMRYNDTIHMWPLSEGAKYLDDWASVSAGLNWQSKGADALVMIMRQTQATLGLELSIILLQTLRYNAIHICVPNS